MIHPNAMTRATGPIDLQRDLIESKIDCTGADALAFATKSHGGAARTAAAMGGLPYLIDAIRTSRKVGE
jgi:hypothetical protein